MLKRMRRLAFAVAAATAIFVIPTSAFSQSFEIGPGGVRIGRGGQCEELRRACEAMFDCGDPGPFKAPGRIFASVIFASVFVPASIRSNGSSRLFFSPSVTASRPGRLHGSPRSPRDGLSRI